MARTSRRQFDKEHDGAEFLYHVPCTSCGSHDAVGVYADGHTYCFSCGAYATGNESAAAPEQSVKGLIPQGTVKPIPSRHLSAETLDKFSYSIGKHNGKTVHIAPYYDRKGNLVAQHLRGEGKAFAWVGKCKDVQLFGQQLWRDGGKMVIVTEGEIDCMSVSQAQGNKYPVVSVPNGAQGAKKALLSQLDWLEAFDRVVLAFDNDAAGKAAAQSCALIFTPGKAHVCTFPLKDASEMLVSGKVREMISCIWEAKVYRPDGLVSGKELWDELIKPPVQGYLTPYPQMNDMLNGIRKGEFYLFSAGSGIGKSTLVSEIAYHFLVTHGLSIGVIALEESKKRTAERYIGMHLNAPIHRDRGDITESDLEVAFEQVMDNDRFWLYDHFGSTNLDNLMNKLRYMIVALQVDFIILDHISIVVSGLDEGDETERKMIDKLMTRIRSLIEETGAGVLAIVHLKRPDKGKSYNEGRQVSLTDLRGSGALEQLSDAVIAMERDQQSDTESNVSYIRVLKNRHVGTVGVCDRLEYDAESGRLRATSPFETSDEKAKVDTPQEGELDF